MMAMAPLDPRTLPLQGVQLIEASAGTGKTWTIASLYLRLVLGHGDVPARWPAQILVVTFTRAATAELRQRIRERLTAAATAFRASHGADDAFLRELIADYPDASDRAIAARRLELAAQWMDEAAVHTIHGWCQRMLAQHTFEGEQNSELTDSIDENARLTEAVRDYWRRFYAVLNREQASQILVVWRGPEALQKKVRPLLRQPLEQLRIDGQPLYPIEDLGLALAQRQAPLDDALRRAREQWNDDAAAIVDILQRAVASSSLSKVTHKPTTVEEDLLAVDGWLNGADTPDQSVLARYTQSKLRKSTNKNGVTPTHAVFDAIEQAIDIWNTVPPLPPLLLAHAIPWITDRLEQARQRQAKLGFDDMLKQLDLALEGEQGDALANAITRQYPVALIDEFQDTDPLQWHIFRRLYRDRPENGLLLIGDPKQAIYSFRGADIHTYLRAREDATAPVWTLLTNYRSTHALVSAVNRVFQHAATQPQGAFGFGDGAQGLPFLPVRANGRKQELLRDEKPIPPLELATLCDEQPVTMGRYVNDMAAHAANHLVQLLSAAQADRCVFVDDQDHREQLRPGHIAVLVRSQFEADAMREALRQRGLSSVYLSDRDSVFASAEAVDLLSWLQACALPSSDRAMRAALATATLHRTVAELDRLNQDEVFSEQCSEQFRQLHFTWQRHGALAMLHNLLHSFDLPARWLTHANGERVLTNVLQLAELLQQAATGLDGEHALIRYLGEQVVRATDGVSDTAEEQIVRLESEADLIKVVTVHKSKGLQYPVVLLPFVCRFRELSKNDIHAWHDAEGHTLVDLQPNDAVWERAERERLQEDLRLLYVALTRAEYACWLGAACVRVGNTKTPALHKSAFGYVLAGGNVIEPANLMERLKTLRGDNRDIVVTALPELIDVTTYRSNHNNVDARPARHYTLTPTEPWWIASYSALTHSAAESSVRRQAPETPTQDVLVEISQEPRERAAMPDDQDIHAFPRGAEAGTFLHGLFEWAAEEGFAQTAAEPAALEKEIARRCQRRGWQAWIKPLSRWLPALLRTPLPLPQTSPMALAQLADKNAYRAELEFLFEAHRVDIHVLDHYVTRYTLDGMARTALPSNRVNGMLRGFIDLIFEHDERFYVIDYKSNWLGAQADAYTQEAMREAVIHSRYDLQYAIYTLALHRQLRARLPDYDYERHMGGVVYLFLRGVDEVGHGVFTERLPVALIDAMDQLFSGGAHAYVA